MNILHTLVNWLESEFNLGTFGQDIFIGGAPQKAPDRLWWLVLRPGSINLQTLDGVNRKSYVIDLYHRNIGNQEFYDDLEGIERAINLSDCPILPGYDVESIRAYSLGNDEDLDREDRQVGVVKITVNLYE